MVTRVRDALSPARASLSRYARALWLPGLVVLAWPFAAPMVWASLVAVAARPGGGFTIFGTLGSLWVGVRFGSALLAARRGNRDATAHRAILAQTPPSDVIQRRARHEAAHAVAAWAMGGTVTAIDIHPVGDRGGQCSYQLAEITDPSARFWAETVICLAANQLDLEAGHADEGATADIMLALTCAAALISTGRAPTGLDIPLTTDAILAAARGTATGLLRDREQLVAKVAEQLCSDPSRTWHRPDLDALARSCGAPAGTHTAQRHVGRRR